MPDAMADAAAGRAARRGDVHLVRASISCSNNDGSTDGADAVQRVQRRCRIPTATATTAAYASLFP